MMQIIKQTFKPNLNQIQFYVHKHPNDPEDLNGQKNQNSQTDQNTENG